MLQTYEKVDGQIKAYINTKNTDYALLLTGKWGCGKTFYIEKLKENLENVQFIYFSLNGLEDIKEIVNSIYLAILSNGNNGERIHKGFKFAKGFTDFIKEKSDIGKLILNFGFSALDFVTDKYIYKIKEEENKEIAIIFDDLERISKNINITDLLGNIHTKFTLKGIKIIYVADNTEIHEKEIFEKCQEKYIRRTIAFTNDKYSVFKSFLEEAEIYSDEFFMILQKVFDEEGENLRTIKFCIDCYLDTQNAYKNFENIDEYNEPTGLFYTICQIGKFYRKGNTDKEQLQKELGSYFYKTYLNKNNDEPGNAYEEFAKEYGQIVVKQNFIYDLIYDGLFSTEELKFYLQKPKINEDPLIKLNNISDMETSELLKCSEEIKENLKNKKYTIRQYGSLRDLFLPSLKKFAKQDEEEIYSLIADSVFAQENQKELTEIFEYWTRDSYSSIQKANNSFESQLLKRFTDFCKEKRKNDTKVFFECIENCKKEIFANTIEHKNIYSEFVELQYVEKLLALPNKSIRFFAYYVEAAICQLCEAYKFYEGELPALKEIKDKCEDKINSIEDRDVLKKEALNYLSNILSQAIMHVEEKM